MKRKFWVGGASLTAVLGLLVAFSFLVPGSFSPAAHQVQGVVQAAEASGGSGISVSGEGEVTITPDLALVQFGLETTKPTAQAAHQENASIFTKISEALKGLKVDEKDIQTVAFNTSPVYDWTNNKQELKGYRVEQIIQVKYRKMNEIGVLLDKASQAGANRVDHIQFTTEKMDEYRIQAMEKAMDNARLKADRLAKKAGVSIRGVKEIREGGLISPPIPYRVGAGMAKDQAAQAPETQVYPGELKIRATVDVTYTF